MMFHNVLLDQAPEPPPSAKTCWTGIQIRSSLLGSSYTQLSSLVCGTGVQLLSGAGARRVEMWDFDLGEAEEEARACACARVSRACKFLHH